VVSPGGWLVRRGSGIGVDHDEEMMVRTP
jgi:hypothetical protein